VEDSLRAVARTLRDAEIPFALTGGAACWAQGGPRPDKDLDLLLKHEDVERAIQALTAAGIRTERPPEQWLVKAWDGDVMIDLIFAPLGLEVCDAMFDRLEERSVAAVWMPVLPIEDVLVTKLLAVSHQQLDYGAPLQMARSLRESIDWDDVRRRTAESPYARAFFCLLEELGVLEGTGRSIP
jgi:hypothetical protein